MKAIENARDRRQRERWESRKASMHVKVEHAFGVIKREFGYSKVHYRSLAKNCAKVMTLSALSNVWMTLRQLVPARGQNRLEVQKNFQNPVFANICRPGKARTLLGS